MCSFTVSAQEKTDVFTKWLKTGQNMDACEAHLVVSKTTSAEVLGGMEELTLRDMIERGFSESLNFRHVFRVI